MKTKKSQASLRHPSNNPLVTNTQRKVAISIPSAERLLRFLSKESARPEMALHFVGKQKISEIHKQFFDDPSPTDCISFPYGEWNFLGEVFVCPQVAIEYAAKHNLDPSKELTLYVVHGFLHLIGFDDREELDRKKMRAEEEKWLQILAKNNLQLTIE